MTCAWLSDKSGKTAPDNRPHSPSLRPGPRGVRRRPPHHSVGVCAAPSRPRPCPGCSDPRPGLGGGAVALRLGRCGGLSGARGWSPARVGAARCSCCHVPGSDPGRKGANVALLPFVVKPAFAASSSWFCTGQTCSCSAALGRGRERRLGPGPPEGLRDGVPTRPAARPPAARVCVRARRSVEGWLPSRQPVAPSLRPREPLGCARWGWERGTQRNWQIPCARRFGHSPRSGDSVGLLLLLLLSFPPPRCNRARGTDPPGGAG